MRQDYDRYRYCVLTNTSKNIIAAIDAAEAVDINQNNRMLFREIGQRRFIRTKCFAQCHANSVCVEPFDNIAHKP